MARAVRVVVRVPRWRCGYRTFVQELAYVHGVVGWVRLGREGTVEIEAQGRGPAVRRFLRGIRGAPCSFEAREVRTASLRMGAPSPDFFLRWEPWETWQAKLCETLDYWLAARRWPVDARGSVR